MIQFGGKESKFIAKLMGFENFIILTFFCSRKYKKGALAAIAGSGKEENKNNRYPMASGFAQPSGLAYSPELKSVFIADSESSSVRMISLKDGSVNHVVGADKTPDVRSDLEFKTFLGTVKLSGMVWSKTKIFFFFLIPE